MAAADPRDLLARRRWWLAGAGVVAVVATLVAIAWWPRGVEPPPVRARVYGQFTSCLLTDEHGVAGSPAASVWAGMQEASLKTRSKVEYLAVVGPQTAENAKTFLASLAQSKCGLVLAAGDAPVDAVNDAAPAFPAVRFVIVGTPGAAKNVTNVTAVDGSSQDGIKSQVATLVATAATAAEHH